MKNENKFKKVFVGGDKNIGRISDQVAKWLTEIMSREEIILISDENTLHIQSYLNARKYRKVTVYHSGEECKWNIGNWETKHLPDVTYENEKNIALAYDCDCGVFSFDRGDVPMRMAIKHLEMQGKPIFVYK